MDLISKIVINAKILDCLTASNVELTQYSYL